MNSDDSNGKVIKTKGMQITYLYKYHEAKNLGAILRSARKRSGMTQEQVALASGIHRNSYSRLERGIFSQRTSMQSLVRILDTMGFFWVINIYPKHEPNEIPVYDEGIEMTMDPKILEFQLPKDLAKHAT